MGLRWILWISWFFLVHFASFGQNVTNLSPEKGAAYFPLILEGDHLEVVDEVMFNGGKAICHHINPAGTKLWALAPVSVKTGPVSLLHGGDTLETDTFTVVEGANPAIDFHDRDTLPQTDLPKDQWCSTDSWGPDRASSYPPAPDPPDEVDRRLWLQARIIAAALKWRYLPYQHHHIPAFDATHCYNFPPEKRVGPGLDCSNYTSWIHLYAFNHHMTSAIKKQASESATGRKLDYGEDLEPGDLLFSKGSPSGTYVTHVSVYIDPGHRIDETGGYCDIRPWGHSGWPHNSFHSARRPLDLIDDTTGIRDDETSLNNKVPQKQPVTIYPNPARDKIHLDGLKKGDIIEIFSPQGVSVDAPHIAENDSILSLKVSHLVPGCYLLVVKGKYRTVSLPFIKMDPAP